MGYRQNYGQVFNYRGITIEQLFSVVGVHPNERYSFHTRPHWAYEVGTFALITELFTLLCSFHRDDELPLWIWPIVTLACGIAFAKWYDRATPPRLWHILVEMELALLLGYFISITFGSYVIRWYFVFISLGFAVLGYVGYKKMIRVIILLVPRDREGFDV